MKSLLYWKPVKQGKGLVMINFDTAFEKKQYNLILKAILKELNLLSTMVNPKDELWRVQDMESNWGVSVRLQANWRRDGVIDYVQIGNKIWYPREAREAFIKANTIKAIGGADDDNN